MNQLQKPYLFPAYFNWYVEALAFHIKRTKHNPGKMVGKNKLRSLPGR